MAPSVPPGRRPRRRHVLGAVLALLLLGALVATRALGGEEPQAPDPAAIAPPDAAVLVEVDLRPEGPQAAALRPVVGRLLREVGGAEAPRTVLARLLGAGDWARDVAPWAGRRAGLFLLAPVRSLTRADRATAVAVADEGRARAALHSGALGGPGAVSRPYAGTTYRLGRDGQARALVGAFLVAGSERAVRAALDTPARGSLGETDAYTRAKPDPATSFAFAYAAPERLLDLLPRRLLPPARREEIRLRLAAVDPPPYVAELSAGAGTLALDLGPNPGPAGEMPEPVDLGGGLSGSSLLPTRLLPGLPAAAWGAVDLVAVGQRLADVASPTTASGQASRAFEGLLARTGALGGLDLRRDVVPWLGSGAAWVQGTGPGDLGLGLVLESIDPAASARFVQRLRAGLGRGALRLSPEPLGLELAGAGFSARLPGRAQRLYVYERGNRVVVAYGRSAALDALDAPAKLGARGDYREASAKLGAGLVPGAFLAPRGLLRFSAHGGLGADDPLRALRPYGRHLSAIALGSRKAVRRIIAVPR